MSNNEAVSHVWLLQYQLERYDLLAETDKGERLDWWRASRHRRRMRIGERIYFLRAKGPGPYPRGAPDAAIVAVGSITSKVEPQDCADCYPWIVQVCYEALVKPELTRGVMRLDDVIGRFLGPKGYEPLTVGKQGTQFLIPTEIADRLERLVTPHLERLTPPVSKAPSQPRPDGLIGTGYKPANEEFSPAVREMIQIDAEHLERANKMHARLQNTLAAYLQTRGIQPLSFGPDEPHYDIAWRVGETIYVCEVKSLTEDNEETQLRLGLSQALMYRHRLAKTHRHVRAVLLVERRPTFDAWISLCTEVGVSLVWARHLDELDLVLQGHDVSVPMQARRL